MEAGLLHSQEQDDISELKRQLTNYIGYDRMHVEVGIYRLLAVRDFIILGSDGLFDNVNVSEAVGAIAGPMPRKLPRPFRIGS